MTSYFIAALIAGIAAFAPCLGAAAGVDGDRYPLKPVRLLLPFAPGGPSDIVARLFAEKLGAALGQQVVADNRGGAAGIIAAETAARSAPDGYTLFLASVGVLTINPHLYLKLPYDPQRDFVPVSLLVASPYLLAVTAKLPVQSVKDLIALAKANPGKLNYGAGPAGTGNHLSAELFKLMAGIDIVHVPYKGATQALTDVASGQVQLWFVNVLSGAPHARTGRVRALAVTSPRRSVSVPEVPTVAESGLSGYDTTSWFGVLLPAKAPSALVNRLHGELARIARQPEVQNLLSSQGADVVGGTPSEFAALIRSDTEKWRKVVAAARIKPE